MVQGHFADCSPRRGSHESCMSYPELLKQKFQKRECRERSVPAGACGSPTPGVPRNSFSLFCAPPAGGAREKKSVGGDTPPAPAKGCCPLQSRFSSHLRGVEPLFEKFGVTHGNRLRRAFGAERGSRWWVSRTPGVQKRYIVINHPLPAPSERPGCAA